jgi:SAM-dependent methyltransferase
VARSRQVTILTEQELSPKYHNFFDVVVISDVFEHLVRPTENLRYLMTTLKPGGMLIISTGDGMAAPRGALFSQFWYYRVPGHLQALCAEHVEWLAKTLNVTIYSQERMSHYDWKFRDWLKQWFSYKIYRRFYEQPQGMLTRLLKMLPRIDRIALWQSAPALTYGNDHIVVALRKPLQ